MNSQNNYLNNKKVKSKFWKRLFLLGGITLGLSMIGAGGFFAINSITNISTSTSQVIVPQSVFAQTTYTDPKTNHSLIIKEYKAIYNHPATSVPNESNLRFYLTKENEDGSHDTSVLKQLAQYIFENLSFGPEISELKSISIGYQQLGVIDVNGFYIPATNEMFIDPNPVIKSLEGLKYSIDPKLNNSNSLSDLQKIQAIFSTIFHEYGHHIATVYASSIKSTDISSEKIYFNVIDSKNIVTESREEIYNSNFYKEFLKYTNLESNSINNSRRYTSSGNSFDSINIGSLTSASELFDIANKKYLKGATNIFKVNDNDSHKFSSTIDSNINLDRKTLGHLEDRTLGYYYSFEEQFTRKYQRLSFSPPISLNDSNQFSNNVKNAIQFYGTSNVSSLSSFGQDILHNFSIKKVGNSYQINNLYLADNPFGGVFQTDEGHETIVDQSLKLYESYLKLIGYGASISQIHHRNETSAGASGSLSVTTKESFDQIKFDGYFDSTKNIKGLVLKNKNNINEVLPIKITTNENFAFKSKSSITSSRDIFPQNTTAFASVLYNSYSTREYVDLNKINLNIPIKFWNDFNNDNELQESELENLVSTSETRKVTNFRSHNSEKLKYYQISNDFIIKKDY
ncbi:MYPU_1760 family metalloprotease [[Mycoplasma] mobile]|uniref:Expressed protein n=1 Tax=Mycoplasma mobile (strain ATCC 43663 / 163K / NCTC 11711) TaxID=267748 RepID=Q6KHE7_MYCM1|nr:hypothetical protein [[Mycoplasma] mobile]AAT27983.1 expressed protein [Mycoplasma mobile 163K]